LLALAILARREPVFPGNLSVLLLLIVILCLPVFLMGTADEALLLLGLFAIGGAVAVVEGARRLQGDHAVRWVQVMILSFFTLPLLIGSPWWSVVRQWHIFERYLAGEYVGNQADFFNEPGYDFAYGGVRQAAGALENQGSGTWRLFVWGDEPGLYYYSGMTPACRFIAHVPELMRSASHRQEVEQMLKTHPPELVVVTQPLDIYPAIHRILNEQYSLFERSGSLEIRRRRDLPAVLGEKTDL